MTRANWFTWLVVTALVAMAALVFTRGAKAQAVVTICLQSQLGPSCGPVTGSNPLPVTGSFSAVTSATATAAAPSYMEGSTNPLSMDLSGGIRITGTINATSAATATAAAPSYMEGTSNPLSQNLTGDQRVIAKQSGTWTNTVTQGTASNLNATVVGTGTFAVQAASTLTAETTKVIGTVNIAAAQTLATVTTVGAVTAITNALPAGTNVIGHVICDSGCSGSGGTSSNFGSSFPAAGTAVGLTDGTNMVAWSATTNYGTAPAAIKVPAANVFVTNTSANLVTNADGIAVVTASGNAGAGSPVNSSGYVFNGTTWDRMPGTTAGVTVRSPTAANFLVTASQASAYPVGATAITASATGTTGATTATLAGTSGKTTYICGYSIRANATANTNVTNTITGVITATLSSIMWVPANTAGLGVDEQIFSPCIPASATNTGIAIVSGAPGTGGLVSSKGWGYQL